jgi:hypothetical protein
VAAESARVAANADQLARLRAAADNLGGAAEWIEWVESSKKDKSGNPILRPKIGDENKPVIDRRLTCDCGPDDSAAGLGLVVNKGRNHRRGELPPAPSDVRARAASLLRLGLRGRASARAARISEAAAKRWMRTNSRREALARDEVGAAAGVDDLRAGQVWAAELAGVSAVCYQAATAAGVALVAAPLDPCRALVARGLSGGETADLRRAVFSRGVRVDGLPVVEWTGRAVPLYDRDGEPILATDRATGDWCAVVDYSGARRVRADSIGIIGRGWAWRMAARAAGAAMHAARYGLGGRDRREVPAGWSLTGQVDGERAAWWESVEVGTAFVPVRPEPSPRPSVARAARAELAAAIWAARAAVARARACVVAAATSDGRAAQGARLGGALRTLAGVVARARAVGPLLKPSVMAAYAARVRAADLLRVAWATVKAQSRCLFRAEIALRRAEEAAAGDCPLARLAAGATLGRARRDLIDARADLARALAVLKDEQAAARELGRARVQSAAVAAWLRPDLGAMTDAGRQAAAAVRKSIAGLAPAAQERVSDVVPQA